MKNLVLWIIVFVAYSIYTFPSLVYSENRAAKKTRALLSVVISATIGYGIGGSLAAVW